MPLSYDGSGTSGGGDLCEDRIKIIRDDLKAWIQDGGTKGLTLPNQISVTQYANAMLATIDSAKIRCVGPQDAALLRLVDLTRAKASAKLHVI
jgi:hypothetical protein